MSEQTAEATEATPEQSEQKSDTDDSSPTLEERLKAVEAEAEKYKALHRKQEDRAKANAEKAKAYDDLKASQMSEQEKAVAQAQAEARAAAVKELAPRLVSAEFRAAAAGRMTAEQLDAFLEDLDLTKYLTEDGDVDSDRVAERIERLAPKSDGKPVFPDLGQGKRLQASTPLDPRSADLAQIEADLRAATGR